MKSWPYFLAATLILAGIVHIAAIMAWPNFVMSRLTATLEESVGVNVPNHADRPTSEHRGVVRPSPDLIYTICAFDVSETALKISAPVPRDTYFSLSMFGDNTDNFFVVNDGQLDKDTVEVVLVKTSDQVSGLGGAPIVIAPSDTGVVLFRTLITSEEQFPTLDTIRRQATCETM
jgi:uncharacterized membrane protein